MVEYEEHHHQALRELQAAFPDHGAEELAAVLSAHDGRGDLAAESLLAEALVDAANVEEDGDGLGLNDEDVAAERAARSSLEQMRADEDYAKLLQVRQRVCVQRSAPIVVRDVRLCV